MTMYLWNSYSAVAWTCQVLKHNTPEERLRRPPFIRQEEIMMTELLTTSNTTAFTPAAPCLDTDPSLEDREHMVGHWQGLQESPVMPILKVFFNCVVPGRKGSSTESKTWWHRCALTQIQMDYPKIKGGGGGWHFHTLSWLSVSPQEIQSFDMVCSSSVCAALPFMIQIKWDCQSSLCPVTAGRM